MAGRSPGHPRGGPRAAHRRIAPGLGANLLESLLQDDVDGRDKPGHDGQKSPYAIALPEGGEGRGEGGSSLLLLEGEGGYLHRPRKPTEVFALRLGLRQVKSLSEAEARRLVEMRGNGYADALALWRRAGLSTRSLEALARADACRSLGLDRREALWVLKGMGG